jgi:hypothetical protein
LANRRDAFKSASLVCHCIMDGKTEARKGGADWEKEAYCHFLWARVKSRRRDQRVHVLTRSCIGSVTPWIVSNESSRAARKWKAIAC